MCSSDLTFERKGADGAVERITREFDMMHAVPPQVAPEFVAKSPLAADLAPRLKLTLDHELLRFLRGLWGFETGKNAPHFNWLSASESEPKVGALA